MKNAKTVDSDILFTIENKIGLLTLNRPEKLNAIRLRTYSDIIHGLKSADDSSECRCIIITGAGGKFTAGNDLSDLIGDRAEKVMEAVQALFDTVTTLKKPLIAAVEGVAVGIGTTLLLHCDLAVASTDTRFRLPFANLGVCPEGGSSALLPESAGIKAANELLLTGRFFSADEALKYGLINAITQKGDSLAKAMEYARSIAEQPPAAILATKSILRRHQSPDISRIVHDELELFLQLALSEETQARIKKYQ
ncbi:enoyl-CoA hydratase/isomerase family protein [Desulfomarina sp.]